MSDRVHHPPHLIYTAGTQVVALRDVLSQDGSVLHPRGAAGVVVKAPVDPEHLYRVRFLDGYEESLRRDEVVMLAKFKEGDLTAAPPADTPPYFDHVIYRCVIGSRAYGLDDDQSDTDYRGIFLPPAQLHWSLYGVPDQIERYETQEQYWELQRFLVLALKANPNVLECLYTTLVEKATPLAEELLAMRDAFLSKLVYQTYNGYVMSQFKKMQADLRNQGQVKWKHVMHLLRLLISGIEVLQTGHVPVRMDAHRDQLRSIKRGEVPWEETESWRGSLHRDFEAAFRKTELPERPDYERVNAFLIRARSTAAMTEPS